MRPDPGSTGIIVRGIFEDIHGATAGAKEHQKYLALLDAAYPPPPKAATGKAPASKMPAPAKKTP